MNTQMEAKCTISSMLGYGGVNAIARKLNLSPGATSAALRRANPGHPAVQEALRIAKESGGLEAAQTLQTFKAS
jgi:hypothetical protein